MDYMDQNQSDHDRLLTMQQMLKEVHSAVMGNGQPGLRDRTAKLETRVGYLQRLLFGVGGLAAGGFITFVLNLIKT